MKKGNVFKWKHYQSDIILLTVRWYIQLNLAIKPLKEAIEIVKDSDQEWQYQHKKWVNTLKENSIFQSMSRKGNCLDNSPMENFFGILKQEMYHGEALCSFEELKAKIDRYMDYYNNKRIKQKLAGMSPVQYRIPYQPTSCIK